MAALLAVVLKFPDLDGMFLAQHAEGLSWLYRLCRSDADRAILAARGITPETRVHHVSALEERR